MPTTNLNVEFRGDASKLNAEIKYTQRQIGELDRQLKQAFKAGNEAGARQLSDTIGGLQTKFTALNRTVAETGDVVTRTSRSVGISARSFRSLDSALFGVSKSFGLAGTAAFGAFKVLSKVSDQITEARKKLLELRDIAQETAQSPAVVKGAQDVVAGLGKPAEDANKILGGIAESFAKVRTGAASAGTAIKDGQSDIEQGVQVMRGSSKATFDLANSYRMLGINQANYKGTAEDLLRLQKDTMTAFLRASKLKLFDPIQLNEISKFLFKGLPADAAIKELPALLAKLSEATAKNNLTAQDIANQEALDAATNRLTKMVDDQIAEHNRLWTYVQTRGAAALADFVDSLPGWVSAWEKWKEGNKQVVESFFNDLMKPTGEPGDPVTALIPKSADKAVADIIAAFGTLPAYFQSLGKTIGNIFNSIFGDVAKGAQKMTEGVADLIKGAQRAAAGGGGAYGVTVGRGGTGDTGGYGPASLGGAGYGPGSRATQSILPGVSDYQAPPAQRLDMSGVARGAKWSQTAAEAASDAAIASKTAAEASKLAVEGWVDRPFNAYAEGGMVHGPGTPTSDSVTARLSAGEFVMRAAAVQRWGPSFMAALNGMGGRMPSRGIPSFADGGMVMAGAGGTPVHLHLGGHSFALSGAGSVVDALVTEAHRHKIRSAGTKPSWYGGTQGR